MSRGQIHGIALAITLLSEGLGMAALSAVSARDRKRWAWNALAAVGVNLATHTVFWYAQGSFSLLLGELVVVLVEAACYSFLCSVSLAKAGAWSLALNLLSYQAGTFAWRVLLR